MFFCLGVVYGSVLLCWWDLVPGDWFALVWWWFKFVVLLLLVVVWFGKFAWWFVLVVVVTGLLSLRSVWLHVAAAVSLWVA